MRDSLKADTLRAALRHHRAGRTAQAEAGYLDLLTRQPDNADALHLLGALLHQTGRHMQAVAFALRAIALNPVEPAYHETLGHALVALGKPEEALVAHARAYLLRKDAPGRPPRAKAG